MPIRTAFEDSHFGRLDVDGGGVDVVADGDVQFTIAPNLGVSAETVLALGKFQSVIHRLAYLPRPFGAGAERSSEITELRSMTFTMLRLSCDERNRRYSVPIHVCDR